MLKTIVLIMLLMVGCFLPVHASSIASDEQRQCDLLPVFDAFYKNLLSAKDVGKAFSYIDPEPALKMVNKGNSRRVVSRYVLMLATYISKIDSIYAYSETCQLEDDSHIGILRLKVKTRKIMTDGADRVALLFRYRNKQWKIISYESWSSDDYLDEKSVMYLDIPPSK